MLGIPIAIAGLWVRRWEVAVALGTVVFTIVLFFDHWASKGYWLAVMPIVGIAAEGWVVRRAPTLVRLLRGSPARATRTAAASGAVLDPGALGASQGGGLRRPSLATESIASEPTDRAADGGRLRAVGDLADRPQGR